MCKFTVQLHFFQEMIEQLQVSSPEESETSDTEHPSSASSSVHSIRLSAAAMGREPEAPVLQLQVDI